MSFETIVAEIKFLTPEQRKKLVSIILDTFLEDYGRTRSILEFEGVGERLRDDQDAQEYVNQLRSEWDHRP